jgi:hypothetical protein
MNQFGDLLRWIDDPESLVRLSEKQVSDLVQRFPELPHDYVQFLREIGYGNLGVLVIYDSPINPECVYPQARASSLEDIVLFGDDMQGFCYGFDLQVRCHVVEVDPRGRIDRTIETGFADFLRSFLGH